MGFVHFALCLSCLIFASLSSWSIENLKQAISNNFQTDHMMRTQELQRNYQQFREQMKASNTSVPAYIQNAKFGYDQRPQKPIYHLFNLGYQSNNVPTYLFTDQPNQHAWISLQVNEQSRVAGLSKEQPFLLLMANDFPYDLLEGIEHWLVWSNREVELELVKAFLKEIIKEGYDCLAYTNPPDKKSIPEIYHAQTFIYRQSKADGEL